MRFAPCKGIQDTLPDSIYWIPDLFQWNLDSGFELLVGFRIPTPVFRIPRPRIPDSTSKNFPDSGIRIRLKGANALVYGSIMAFYLG